MKIALAAVNFIFWMVVVAYLFSLRHPENVGPFAAGVYAAISFMMGVIPLLIYVESRFETK